MATTTKTEKPKPIRPGKRPEKWTRQDNRLYQVVRESESIAGIRRDMRERGIL